MTTACGAAVPEGRDTSMGAPVPAPNAADSLELEFELSSEPRVGEAVQAVLHVRNAAGRAIDLYLRGRTVTVDVVADRLDGSRAWRLLDGAIIPAVVYHRRLEPEEMFDVPMSWTWSLAAGSYRLRALLLTEGEPLTSERVPVVLRP